MGDEEKNVETTESTDTQGVTDNSDLIDTGLETDQADGEPTESDGESTDTSTDEDGTQDQTDGTLLPDDLQEKYGIKTHEELAELLKKAENADKIVTEQGRELGELRKLKADVDALKASEERTSQETADNEYRKVMEASYKRSAKYLQDAFTKEDFDSSNLGEGMLNAIGSYFGPHMVQPMIREAIAEPTNAITDAPI